ncbi:hypothetical protein NQ314_004051 [Rhamnusium bicolor]|uniref:Cytoplasmic tRNA 2-thiolation protein 2 n=1 Tax=Rhamnusium bicolor TaxID=1586634 RepID=A0AAV8ZNR5_9CUCU|nr:hypothetical protein NQ314_004051 [Rhamnusium bicolor]
MCSVSDENFENEADKVMVKSERRVTLSANCNKCRTAKSCVVLRNKDTYCKNCFLAGATHKFKALIGKSRLIRPNDRDILKKVEQEVTSFGFKLYCISFVEYILNPSIIHGIIENNELNISENDKDRLWDILVKKTSKTNKTDVINLFMRQLLVDAAKYLNCKFIFTPEISIDIASHLLTNISLGRGCHVPIDTGFCDERDEDVKILRPLRLFDLKELAFYNKFNNLDPICIRHREVNPYSSVQDLMKKFVKDLQENFPATVTTVMKTGDKLALDKDNTEICKLCKVSIINSMFRF